MNLLNLNKYGGWYSDADPSWLAGRGGFIIGMNSTQSKDHYNDSDYFVRVTGDYYVTLWKMGLAR